MNLFAISNIYDLFVSAELDAFKGKQMPEWIKNNPLFEGKKDVKKVFPVFGLKNFKEKVDLKPDNVLLQNSKMELLCEQVLRELEFHITNIIKLFKQYVNKADYEKLLRVRDDFNLWAKIIPESSGVYKIIMPEDIIYDATKTLAKAGQSIWKVFDAICKFLQELGKQYNINVPDYNYQTFDAVKQFNKLNVPTNNDFFVVFSSEGSGAWDLATMSERGIKSCQRWDQLQSECLIGSIISKYVGIIYLTSGSDFEGRGDKMMARSIVRFGVQNKKSPVIIVDRMYPQYDEKISQLFIDALKKRTNLPVYNYAAKFDYFQPFVANNEEIPKNDEKFKEILKNAPKEKEIHIPKENIEFERSTIREDGSENYEYFGQPSYMDTPFDTPRKDVRPSFALGVDQIKELYNYILADIGSFKTYSFIRNILKEAMFFIEEYMAKRWRNSSDINLFKKMFLNYSKKKLEEELRQLDEGTNLTYRKELKITIDIINSKY